MLSLLSASLSLTLISSQFQVLRGASHKLLQYEVDETTYYDVQVRFASKYVTERLFSRLEDFRNTLLYDFIRVATQSPSKCSQLGGGLFEIYCHRHLRSGKTLEGRSLEREVSEKLDTPSVEPYLWSETSVKGTPSDLMSQLFLTVIDLDRQTIQDLLL